MQEELSVFLVGIFVEVINAISVECRGTADDAVDFIAFGEEEFTKVRTVLTSNACDESAFLQGMHTICLLWVLMITEF